MFRADGQPSRDDECEHGFRRFEKCAHCLETEIKRLHAALQQIADMQTSDEDGVNKALLILSTSIARKALEEKQNG